MSRALEETRKLITKTQKELDEKREQLDETNDWHRASGLKQKIATLAESLDRLTRFEKLIGGTNK